MRVLRFTKTVMRGAGPAASISPATMPGTVMMVDAADATSSGASGDSNAILWELRKQGYGGSVLAPPSHGGDVLKERLGQ